MAPHILIIDADRGAAHITRVLVARLARDATLAVEATPARGRAILRQRLANVLIIDPAPDHHAAEELIAWLNTEHPTARVIVLASVLPSALRNRFTGLGIELYQEKQSDPMILMEQVQRALARSLPAASAAFVPDSAGTHTQTEAGA